MITVDQLRKIMPNAGRRVDVFYPHLAATLTEFEINTPIRAAAFLSQLAHESGELRYTEEIASGAAYEGRVDLGNTHPGDGVRFKGRGLIQITGRSNYFQLSSFFGIDFVAEPERLARPEWAARSAGWFWSSRKLNTLADVQDFRAITKKINGGYNGYADRQKYYRLALEVFGESQNEIIH